jgi:D-alanyl-D-alanine carboxypeptidase (penicillin-binding protein 5/6)
MARNHTVDDKKRQKILIILLICVLCFSFAVFAFGSEKQDPAVASARSAGIVMEATTFRVLQGTNIDARLPMASTTKAMTALVVIEHCDMEAVVTVPKAAVGIEGSSIYLREGEKLTVKELLYGLMLRSGNDAATALAIHAGGSVQGFVKMMNDKAAELGLKNTHFCNPHGLHDNNHYTSAYDLAVIASVGIQNPVFKEICSARHVRISGDNEESIRDLYNKNKILSMYSGGNGIKTGYTKKAGRCLIASSLRDNMQVVAVVLNTPDMWEECMRLMDYAHDTYCMTKVVDKTQPAAEIAVKEGKVGGVYVRSASVYPAQDRYYPLKKDGSEVCKAEVIVPAALEAPHEKSQSIGKIQIKLCERLIFEEKLYTMDTIEKKDFKDKIKDFFGIKHGAT